MGAAACRREPGEHVQVARPRHADVEDEHVGLERADRVEHFVCAPDFAHHLHLGCALENAANPFAHHGVVVRDEDSGHRAACGPAGTSGSVTRIAVPAPGADSAVMVPPPRVTMA